MCTALHSVYNTFPERDKTSAGGGLSLGVTSVSGIWDRPRGSHPPRPRARLANEEIKVKWLNKRTPNGEGRAGTGTQSPPGSEKRPSLHLEALNVTPVVAGWSPGLQSLTPGQVRILPSQLLRNSASRGPCTRLAVVATNVPASRGRPQDAPRGRPPVLGHRTLRLWRLLFGRWNGTSRCL